MVYSQVEEEQRSRDELREQMTASERRAVSIAGELEELRAQLEAAERARKAAESELHEATDRVSELNSTNISLSTAKRKIEIDIQSMQVSCLIQWCFHVGIHDPLALKIKSSYFIILFGFY